MAHAWLLLDDGAFSTGKPQPVTAGGAREVVARLLLLHGSPDCPGPQPCAQRASQLGRRAHPPLSEVEEDASMWEARATARRAGTTDSICIEPSLLDALRRQGASGAHCVTGGASSSVDRCTYASPYRTPPSTRPQTRLRTTTWRTTRRRCPA